MTTNRVASSERVLAGRTVLVTGAAKRLGRATALASAERGANVAITYRESAREAQALVAELAKFGGEALAVRCDITDEKSVREMVKEVVWELGGIDVLVNNAANYETVEFEKISVRSGMQFLLRTRAGHFWCRERRCRIYGNRRADH